MDGVTTIQADFTSAEALKCLDDLPIDDLPGRIDEVPQDKKVLFICAAGVRSGLACEIAASMGYDSENLFNIEDGTPFWIQANLPTSYGNEP